MIRKANKKDILKIKDIYNRVVSELQSKGISQWDYKEDTHFLNDLKYQFIYLEEDVVKGSFSVKPYDGELSIPKNAHYLYQVMIDPKYFGEGMGMRMIKEVQEYFQELYLDCFNGNEKLKQFYLECGFKLKKIEQEEYYLVAIYYYG
jgi:RimJ/RimL family protein N-acetyltransferase